MSWLWFTAGILVLAAVIGLVIWYVGTMMVLDDELGSDER